MSSPPETNGGLFHLHTMASPKQPVPGLTVRDVSRQGAAGSLRRTVAGFSRRRGRKHRLLLWMQLLPQGNVRMRFTKPPKLAGLSY